MKVIVLDSVAKEMKRESDELKQSVYGVLHRLEMGELIPMPLCRPLYTIARGLHEVRLSDKVGEFRVFYYLKIGDAIYVIHAMRKKTQKMEKKTIELLKKRIGSL
jgi:phage-related protein